MALGKSAKGAAEHKHKTAGSSSSNKRPKKSSFSSSPAAASSSSSSSSSFTAKQLVPSTAAAIGEYHEREKQLQQLQSLGDLDASQQREVERLRKQLAKDLDAYQKASMFGASAGSFVCARWVEPILREHRRRADDDDNDHDNESSSAAASGAAGHQRLSILDVGAIDDQFRRYESWLDVTAIDLNPQARQVIRSDFFDFAHARCSGNTSSISPSSSPSSSLSSSDVALAAACASPPYDAIVLSLVVNFVGDPRRRGDMLALAAHPRMLRTGGLLFVALPAAALDNSRYMDTERLGHIMESLGFEQVAVRSSAKITMMTLRLERPFAGYDPLPAGGDGASGSGGGGGGGGSGKHTLGSFTYSNISSSSSSSSSGEQGGEQGGGEVGREVLRGGAKRNNFCIMLKDSAARAAPQKSGADNIEACRAAGKAAAGKGTAGTTTVDGEASGPLGPGDVGDNGHSGDLGNAASAPAGAAATGSKRKNKKKRKQRP
eukprot:g3878.t1